MTLSNNYQYESFEDWYYELENYGLRMERFHSSLEDKFTSDAGKLVNLEIWLRAAFDSARLPKE